jgi:hypothetical protein
VGAAAEMLTICAGLQSLQLLYFFVNEFLDSIAGTKLGLIIMFVLLE